VFERSLSIIAIALSVIVAAGFCLFATDEFNRASTKQTDVLAGYELADPTPAGERQREQRNSNAREYIDDANDVLLKPFAGVAESGTRWVQRIVPTMLGLFFYGFVLGYIARFAKGRGKASALRFAPNRG